jgi:hypothetical protein
VDESVSSICRRLDDLPLALELAAARVKALAPRQILERLEPRLPLLTTGTRDAPERQRTLKTTIEWSYKLLSEEEQRLFARFAVFRRGCTLEAAEAVCDADIDTLHSLVDKSLLRRRDERFWMLETIREYAAERLTESGELEKLRRRHAEHFLALTKGAEPHVLASSEQWADRLEVDHDNVRAAFDTLERAGETSALLRLTGAIWRFWWMHDHLAEGRRRIEAALKAAPAPNAARAKALNGAAVMALRLDPAVALSFAEEALALHRTYGDRWGAAYAGMVAGNTLAEGKGRDVSAAAPRLEESLRQFRELGDTRYVGIATSNLSWVVGVLGDKDRERALQEDALEIARSLGDRGLEAVSLGDLAMIAGDEGRYADGVTLLRESVGLWHSMGERTNLAFNLGRLANLLALAGDVQPAARLLASSERLMEELGASNPWYVVERNAKTPELAREWLGDAALAQEWNEGLALSLEDAVALALEPVSTAERDEARLVEP